MAAEGGALIDAWHRARAGRVACSFCIFLGAYVMYESLPHTPDVRVCAGTATLAEAVLTVCVFVP